MNCETSDTTFTYDWQRQEESFLKWMIPTLISGIDPQTFDQLSEATDKWTHVELNIQINGISVPVENFINSIERNMTHYANQEAARLVSSIPELRQLRDAMEEADMELRQRLTEILANAGIELENRNEQ